MLCVGALSMPASERTCFAPFFPVLRLVLSQNKKELIINWFNEGKLESSEELGDLVHAAGEVTQLLAEHWAKGRLRRKGRRGLTC